MARCQLRVYYGPDDCTAIDSSPSQSPEQRVTVPLRDILGTLTDAVNGRRGWLHDFEDDEVSISTDLYEVLLAYQHYRRPSA